MKNVIILGASGGIASLVTDMLLERDDIHLTLFARNTKRLRTKATDRCRIVQGDVLDPAALNTAIKGQDIVYANLAGELGAMARAIEQAMKENGVQRIVFISSIGIYDTPLKPVLKPYRAAADVIEASGLDYTIIRPQWFTEANEVDYELTQKGSPERGSVISRKSLATLITDIIVDPAKHSRANISINKPRS